MYASLSVYCEKGLESKLILDKKIFEFLVKNLLNPIIFVVRMVYQK